MSALLVLACDSTASEIVNGIAVLGFFATMAFMFWLAAR